MKNFLTTTKGKVIAGLSTVGVVAAVIVAVVLLNRGYRTIAVEQLTGVTKVTDETQTAEAYVGQHLKSGNDVLVSTSSDITLGLDGDKYVYGEEGTHFWVEATGKKGDERTLIHLADGSTLCRIDERLGDKESFQVETPNATMSVRGTVFRISSYNENDKPLHEFLGTEVEESISGRTGNDTYTVVEVYEGKVFVQVHMESGENTKENRVLSPGECAIIRSNDSISEFIKSDAEIEYSLIPKAAAYFLGRAIEEGRELCITEELLYDIVGINEHEFEEEDKIVEATCTQEGMIYQVCRVCGLEVEKEVIPMKEHEPVVEKPGKSCENDGYEITYCKVCETELDKQLVEATGHEFGDWETEVEASCLKEGLLVAKCKNCDVVMEQETEALGHSYGKPTLVETNTKTKKSTWKRVCSRCKLEDVFETDSDVEDPVPEDCSKGHSFVENKVDPTCTQDGKITRKCSVCGYETQTALPSTGHNFGASIVTKEATCTEKGVSTKTCSRCNDTVTEDIAAKGHNYGAAVVTKEATCTEKGVSTQTCSRCSDKKTEDIAAKGHNYGAAVVTKEPTCTEAGKSTKTCSRCNDQKSEDVAATGHSYGAAVVTKEATCTEKGVFTSTCSKCNDKKTEDIAPTGHSYGAYVVTTQPTCTAKGVETATCSKCNDKKTADVAAKGHSYGPWVINPQPTCTNAGTKKKTCSVCNDVVTDTEPATGHKYGAWIEDAAPTCTRTGKQHRVCSVCSDSYEEGIPALGHSYGPWQASDAGGWGHGERSCTRCAFSDRCNSTNTKYVAATHEPNMHYVYCNDCGQRTTEFMTCQADVPPGVASGIGLPCKDCGQIIQ